MLSYDESDLPSSKNCPSKLSAFCLENKWIIEAIMVILIIFGGAGIDVALENLYQTHDWKTEAAIDSAVVTWVCL